jgi:hypothetical protein
VDIERPPGPYRIDLDGVLLEGDESSDTADDWSLAELTEEVVE